MDILLVEDSATLRANMGAVLTEMGHRVHCAESGETCLHLIELCQHDLQYDLVLMEVELPGLDGFETTRLLREILKDQWIPIIFVTAVTDEASYARGIEAGGDDYLAKPVSAVILKAKIRAMERIAEMQGKLARLNRALRSTSEHDTLTHLLNRRAFNRKAERRWQLFKRRGLTTAVIMLDVDHFKPYNDTYGHQQGDQCLRQVAAAIRRVLSDSRHLVARYGGEEFVVLLSGTTEEKANAVAEALRQGIFELAIAHKSSPVKRITISAGVAITSNLHNHSLDKLISAADKQLYRVKSRGRNGVSCAQLDTHKTILICVSDPQQQSQLSQLLGSRGNIVTAENGPECIDIATYIVPDLVVIGTAVTGPSGECSCAELRRRDATASIPIVLLREDVTHVRCGRHGGERCVTSVSELNDITSVVESFLH